MTAPASEMPSPLALDHDALRSCVHCGICLPQCPTYRVLGEEMDSPRGRIYLMRAAAEGRIAPSATFARHIDLCLGCRACETACPAGVPFGSLLEATRAELQRRGLGRGHPRAFTRLLFALFPHPGRLGPALAAARLYQRSGLRALVRSSGLLRLTPRLAAMDALLPDVPAAATLPEVIAPRGARLGRAALLAGCVQRHLQPHVNRDAARLLSLAGWEVVIPRGQGCCGALDLHAGRIDEYRARGRALAALFADADVVVTTAAGCGAAMRDWARWLDGDAAQVAGRVRDVTQVLAQASLPLGPLHLTATYHDACHLVHAQKIRLEPRALLARIPGLRLVPLADSDVCCGSAGVYNLLEPDMAEPLLEAKLTRIAETGVSTVVTGNPGCMLQIAKGARARGLDLEVVHPVELVARAVDAAGGR